MKKLLGVVLIGLAATISFCSPTEPEMLTVELGNGVLTFKAPVQRIVQVQLKPKPEYYGLDASAKVETSAIVISQNIVLEFTSVNSEGKKITKPILMGKFIDPGTGKTLDLKKISGEIRANWQILKTQAFGKDSLRETWLYMSESQAFEITVDLGDVKDKKAQEMKKQILESIAFNPGPEGDSDMAWHK